MNFIDESLAKGLARKFTREVEERNDRHRSLLSERRLNELYMQVLNGVTKKKQCTHYEQFLREYQKANATMAIGYPVNNKDRSSFGEEKGVVAVIKTANRNDQKVIVLCLIYLLYNKKYLSITHSTMNPATIIFDSNHVLARYIQREKKENVYGLLGMVGYIWLYLSDIIKNTEMTDCSILLLNGGMLLGKLEIDLDSKAKIFVAKTYLSKHEVCDFNFKNCLNPYDTYANHTGFKENIETIYEKGQAPYIESMDCPLENLHTVRKELIRFKTLKTRGI